jgi:hypothetical protein
MLDIFLLEPCLSHLALVLQVIILLEDNTQFPSSPQIKVLQGPEIVVIKDLDIVWPTHNTLNSVKSSHVLSSDTSLYYQVASTMLDVFFGKTSI